MWAYTRSAYLRLHFSHPQTKLRARPICQRMAARQAGTGNQPPWVLYADLLELRITQSSSPLPGFVRRMFSSLIMLISSIYDGGPHADPARTRTADAAVGCTACRSPAAGRGAAQRRRRAAGSLTRMDSAG